MIRQILTAAVFLVITGLCVQVYVAEHRARDHPMHSDARWIIAPDADAVDRVLDTPAAGQLAGSFLRSQNPFDPGSPSASLRRAGAPVLVYATDPKFAGGADSTLRSAGMPSYLAVPVHIGSRSGIDMLQLTPSPPYSPQAIAAGTEEAEAARALTPGARLLLDYPSHTWFGWTETRVTAIRSNTDGDLAGKVFDTGQFKQWLASR
ncbi:hypothetical protein ACIP5Y_11360 [Nocardia sp. NPDC088792]|uniref:hypothetical protein n=1 Tax=Nocardia sp. NPDC088792 TaxID=3364332 RepID=UPI0037FAE370